MTDRLLFFIWALGWPAGVIGTVLAILCAFATWAHAGSLDQKLERIRGLETTYPTKRWVALAVAGWCAVYVLWP